MISVATCRQIIGEHFNTVVDTCRNQLDKVCDSAGCVKGLDSLKAAPKNLEINLARILGEPSDQASIKGRLDSLGIQRRQLANVLAHCVPEAGEPTAGRLTALHGESLKDVIGERPRQRTTIQEHMRAGVEMLGYFVNHRIRGLSLDHLQNSCPTVKLLQKRSIDNQSIDISNSHVRAQTAKKFADFSQEHGLPGAVQALAALLSDPCFKAEIAQFPNRLSAEVNSKLGASETKALPKAAKEECCNALPAAELTQQGKPSNEQKGTFINSDMPEIAKEPEPRQTAADTVEPQGSSLVQQDAITQKSFKDGPFKIDETPRDWITLTGRAFSALTLLIMVYSYLSQQTGGAGSTDLAANLTKMG